MAATMLKWTIRNANARTRSGKGGESLIITGTVTGPDGDVNKTHSLTLKPAQLKGSSIDFSGYKPGDASSVIVVTRPESNAKRGRKPAKGAPVDTLNAFVKRFA